MSAGPRDVAVVTGGAGAIGAAVCHRLADAGRQVVVVDLDAAAAQDVAARLTADGHTGVGLDVADTDAVAAAMGKVAVDVGPVGTLINVAGWDRFVPFVDTTPEFWDRVIGINYRGTLNTVHAVLPGMIERQRGRIVSVASDAARVGSSLEADLRRGQGCGDLVLEERRPRGGPLRHHGQRGLPGSHRHTAHPHDGRRARLG